MKILYLLRHAKSSWGDPMLDDFSRPLAPRGIKACKLMAAHIIETDNVQPDLILCSPAKRAKETYKRIAHAFASDTPAWFEDGLYEAAAQTLMRRLRDVDDEVSSLMMIGHNPALEDLTVALTRDTPTEALVRVSKKFPTLGLVRIEFVEGGWSEVGPGRARLTDFVIPRDLGENRK